MAGVLAIGALGVSCQSASLTAAKLYIKQEQPERAKQQLLEGLQTEPQNPEIPYLLGTLYGKEGDYAAMVDAFGRSLALSPKYASQIDEYRRFYWIQSYNNGIRYARTSDPDYAAARQAFEAAVLIDSARLEAWRNLAFARYHVDDIDGAIAAYEHIASSAPTDTVTFNSLGVLYLGESRPTEAARAFQHVLELDPVHQGALVNLAVVYTDAGRLAEAEELYLRATTANPEASPPYYNLGNLYWNQKRYKEAATAYGRAVELTPDDPDARFNLAVTFLSLDDPDSALPLLQKLSEDTPDNGSVWRELGRTWALKGKVRESEHAYERAEALGEFAPK
ncbi:MAG: tetratricopeptide repeat protein [Gemmatimonadota bacterium]